jgi:ATP-dependent DNA helicase 2 subunit 1
MIASEDLMDFNNKFGSSEGANISEVLFLCSTMFTLSSNNIRTKEIIWFTNQDSPHQPGQHEHYQAFQKAKDLQQLSFHVFFFPISPEFDGSLFWKEFIGLLMDQDIEDVMIPEYAENFNSFVNRRCFKKRAIAYLDFEVTEKSKFGVGLYSNKRATSTYPKCTKHSRINNEEIVTKRVTKFAEIPQFSNNDEATDDTDLGTKLDFSQKLDPSSAIKYQEVDGEKICFSTLEAFEIKQIMDPKVKLIGFKPRSMIDECHYHVKTQLFLYPHDGQIKKSSVFFRSLWERLLIDQLVAICIMTMRLKSYPRLVALIPTEQIRQDEEIRDLDEVYSDLPGYADGDEATFQSKFNKLTKKLRVPFSPMMLENPICGRLYTRIEAQTYDEEINTTTLDSLNIPNVEAQDQRMSKLVDEIEDFINGFEEENSKRKAEKADNEKEKLQKTDINMKKILEDCKSGNVKNITVDMLREYLSLKSVNGTSKMKKSFLVDKIVEMN